MGRRIIGTEDLARAFPDEVIARPDFLNELKTHGVETEGGLLVPESVADVLPIKEYYPEIKVLDKSQRQIEFIITTQALDREDDTIALDGWDTGMYLKNPVVLWAHLYRELPVAKSIELGIAGPIMRSIGEFVTEEIYKFGATVYEMLKAKFLNAVSVGFRPIKYSFRDDSWGIDWLEQELLEYSVVPVPANAEALVLARSAGVDISPYMDWVDGCKSLVLDERIMKAVTTARPVTVPVTMNIGKEPDKKTGEEDNGMSEVVEAVRSVEQSLKTMGERLEHFGTQISSSLVAIRRDLSATEIKTVAEPEEPEPGQVITITNEGNPLKEALEDSINKVIIASTGRLP